jgi:hypothetical protein
LAGEREECSGQWCFDETLSGRKYEQVQDREIQVSIYMSKVGEEIRKEIKLSD